MRRGLCACLSAIAPAHPPCLITARMQAAASAAAGPHAETRATLEARRKAAAGLIAARPVALAASKARHAPRFARARAPPRPRPPAAARRPAVALDPLFMRRRVGPLAPPRVAAAQIRPARPAPARPVRPEAAIKAPAVAPPRAPPGVDAAPRAGPPAEAVARASARHMALRTRNGPPTLITAWQAARAGPAPPRGLVGPALGTITLAAAARETVVAVRAVVRRGRVAPLKATLITAEGDAAIKPCEVPDAPRRGDEGALEAGLWAPRVP